MHAEFLDQEGHSLKRPSRQSGLDFGQSVITELLHDTIDPRIKAFDRIDCAVNQVDRADLASTHQLSEPETIIFAVFWNDHGVISAIVKTIN